MRLKQLASLLTTARLLGDEETQIDGIQIDSRKVSQGDLFIALPGHTVDGHTFAPKALANGAKAMVVERQLDLDVPQLIVKDSRLAMAVIADYYFAKPSQKLKLIGITGTNGKTTTTYLIERILKDAGFRPGVIGTVEMRYADQSVPMSGTTPEALDLQRHLAAMVEAGTDFCAMEVSSHALEQGRVKGCRYRTAIFTNLTQDHLDYHGTMENYAAAKGLLFSRLGNEYASSQEDRSYAVLNADDAASAAYAGVTSAEVLTYGVDNEADVRATSIHITAQGTSFHLDTFRGSTDITLQMTGKFNVYNALAAISAALIEQIPLEQIKASLEALPGVPGRVESVIAGQPFSVIVDYAHSPDGLENVLRAVKEYAVGRIICVFGCGGDRDRTKRPIMGKIAAHYADYAIITSDNPRTEDPDRILLDIEAGLIENGIPKSQYQMLPDRRAAIQKAVEMASPNDVVLIAGKGHETYQLIGGATYHFDDREVAKEAIRSIL
ncbi:UDP-N-acetylmuramoyl-L-alanyl-D-glutamate--2,6-diaminopimelate ligase [Paenibacillus baekrokdamisoli]|uniref:UDP-N-acetylmuramoyl-L-alanyl-D-glutamate--2,6-diaminopimelate ligase n=1 Tax=Paenibacillus baekrokdamisoli TaxID=1712516 RepID=A0A3G9IS52_9BACL|nr:UDP-N-acetylmuramoyl-L-alanyl-D-glutamate--2,6-diaminopimelate ligase [Paenibacillus baekrokdamisoli]MBB3070221.1 UDP-N-acetylmuramoyl-L-alanyl-D-glutamate--2,6-diaminopimelate ligase [Paenibacillus baekrokdamisoli]BBH21226.1 UDP-N-acetylmuramoyl-L-alanyl-D-glutamate--2,6-diaminopimelate ligase [Paenibacillus baekrokdamisoli]